MKGWPLTTAGWLRPMVVVIVAASVLAGCSTRSVNRAPVEDRGATATGVPSGSPTPVPSGTVTIPPAVATLPGAENAGKPGYYSVRPGDTLIRIGLDTGQSWRDIARWSNLDNPNRIEVGQVLRIIPPVAATATVMAAPVPVAQGGAASAAGSPPTPASGAVAAARPVAPSSVAVAALPPAGPAGPAVPSAPAPAAVPASPDELNWVWPANGSVLAGFDEVRNKGLDIAGNAGDPVIAAADGEVVYVGAGLRGYGNLIVLKHNNTYITAYAHNQTLLVKEDQRVRKGQKIAEMGNSDSDRVKLHFELRRQGKPIDPARYLPAR